MEATSCDHLPVARGAVRGRRLRSRACLAPGSVLHGEPTPVHCPGPWQRRSASCLCGRDCSGFVTWLVCLASRWQQVGKHRLPRRASGPPSLLGPRPIALRGWPASCCPFICGRTFGCFYLVAVWTRRHEPVATGFCLHTCFHVGTLRFPSLEEAAVCSSSSGFLRQRRTLTFPCFVGGPCGALGSLI